MFGMTFKAAKEGFFDRDKITSLVGEATIKNLSKMGAFVRQTAKKSMGRKRKHASAPGQPPSVHLGLLKDLLFFLYDASHHSVVVGPTLINRSTGAPHTLEFGGEAEIEEFQFRRRGGKTVHEKVKRTVTIKPRPYMGPALEAEKPGFEKLWANSIK